MRTEGTVVLELTVEEYLYVLALTNHGNSADHAKESPCRVPVDPDEQRWVAACHVDLGEARDLMRERAKAISHPMWQKIRTAGSRQLRRVRAGITIVDSSGEATSK